MALAPYTCSPDDQVFEDIEIWDAQNNLMSIIVSTECTAEWLCGAAPEFGMWGPHYPLTWRHTPPPEPVEEEPAPPVDEEQTPAP
jgi:hypothetical protein